MIRAHAVYEGVYLLGTSIARPLIAKRQIEIAKKFDCRILKLKETKEIKIFTLIKLNCCLVSFDQL